MNSKTFMKQDRTRFLHLKRVWTVSFWTLFFTMLITGATVDCAEKRITQAAGAVSDFVLKDLNGNSISLSGFRGRPSLLNFWATWCEPCLEEMPMFQRVYTEWSKKGLVVLSINMGESIARVKGCAERYKLTFPVLLDKNSEVFAHYGVRVLPTTLLLDKKGVIAEKRVGAFSNQEQLEKEFLSGAFGRN
jgi:peroxiredoxin